MFHFGFLVQIPELLGCFFIFFVSHINLFPFDLLDTLIMLPI